MTEKTSVEVEASEKSVETIRAVAEKLRGRRAEQDAGAAKRRDVLIASLAADFERLERARSDFDSALPLGRRTLAAARECSFDPLRGLLPSPQSNLVQKIYSLVGELSKLCSVGPQMFANLKEWIDGIKDDFDPGRTQAYVAKQTSQLAALAPHLRLLVAQIEEGIVQWGKTENIVPSAAVYVPEENSREHLREMRERYGPSERETPKVLTNLKHS